MGRIIVIMIAAALFLNGCRAEPYTDGTAANHTSAPTATLHTGGGSPESTASGEESDLPEYVVQAARVEVSEVVPAVDPNADKAYERSVDRQNHPFRTTYIYTHLDTATARTAYDGEIFWVPEGPLEYNSGNHYTNYTLKDGALNPLPKKYFSREYSLFGQSLKLELEYSVLNGKVLINYEPSECAGYVVDTGRGVHECLVRFSLDAREGKYIQYYAAIDLETGVLTDYFSQFDPDVFAEEYQVLGWCDNNDLILCAADGELSVLDVSGQEKLTCIPKSDGQEVLLRNWVAVEDGIVYCVSYYEPTLKASRKLQESTLWKISTEDGSVTRLWEDKTFYNIVLFSQSYILYQDEAGMYFVCDPATMECRALPDLTSYYKGMDSLFIYKDSAGEFYVYDIADGESVAVRLPDGWEWNRDQLAESPDGRKFATYHQDANGVFQLLVFDADTNSLTALHRSAEDGGPERQVFLWSENNGIVVSSGDRRSFCVYDLE